MRIDATVWAWTTPSADRLDLYFTSNAISPTWTFIGTVAPTVAGAQTLSATYTLPAGALQAVRAQFRYQGSGVSLRRRRLQRPRRPGLRRHLGRR